LRLRLAKCGRTFRGLVDEIRQEMALSYLQNPDLGLVDIAYLLGFSEQSAFQRAFKRWTGHSPGEYRQSL
jgi:AraC-like DNA-binding protein